MKALVSHSALSSKYEPTVSLPLFGAVLCVDCERISASHNEQCPVCGSKSLISIEQIMGGTLSGDRVRLVESPKPPRMELARTA